MNPVLCTIKFKCPQQQIPERWDKRSVQMPQPHATNLKSHTKDLRHNLSTDSTLASQFLRCCTSLKNIPLLKKFIQISVSLAKKYCFLIASFGLTIIHCDCQKFQNCFNVQSTAWSNVTYVKLTNQAILPLFNLLTMDLILGTIRLPFIILGIWGIFSAAYQNFEHSSQCKPLTFTATLTICHKLSFI